MTLLMTLLYAREIKSISTIIMSDSAIGRFSPRFVIQRCSIRERLVLSWLKMLWNRDLKTLLKIKYNFYKRYLTEQELPRTACGSPVSLSAKRLMAGQQCRAGSKDKFQRRKSDFLLFTLLLGQAKKFLSARGQIDYLGFRQLGVRY